MADHALQIAFYLLVAHPRRPVAIFSQPPAALFISSRLTEVYIAIYFDHQPVCCTIEVSDVRPDWMLPVELEAAQSPAAQPVPQDHLGGCHLLSQLPGALAGFVEAVFPWHNPIPCPNYRADFQSKHNLFDGRPASLELGRGRAGLAEGELGFASPNPPYDGVIFRFDVCAEACGINFVQEPHVLS
jgi:hypothetical protein